MNNPNILIFLGAGSSSCVGYCTFQNFISLIFNNEIRQKEHLPEIDPNSITIKLLKEIEKSFQIFSIPATHDNFLRSLDDYRKLWYTLRTDNVLRSRFLKNTYQWGEYSYFSQITENAINDITQTTVTHYSSNKVKDIKNNSTLYGSLKKMFDFYIYIAYLNNDKYPYIPIFTTNYDMLIEDLFSEFYKEKINIQLCNGIKGYQTEGAIWSQTEYETKLTGIHLYRLHGCTCFYYHNRDYNKIYFHREKVPAMINELYAIYPGREISLGLNPHAYSFRKLYEMIIKCKIIVFIGFSFRDDDVLHILLSAIKRRSESLKLIVLDPNLTQNDIYNYLSDSSSKTQYPIEIPKLADILNIETGFGDSNSDVLLKKTIERIL